MRLFITTALFITFSIMNVLSQDLSGVWHGIAKTPDNKEITFVFLFEKNENTYTSTMAIPTFNVESI